MPKFVNIPSVNTNVYKVNPEFVSAVFKDPFVDTAIVLSGGLVIKTTLSVEEVMLLFQS